uniref:Uncharacterized protein n=1 Tax=Candidatus Kentrum sp. LFY TaxID=2126342 RepID=A0A450U861_9GAMM|nr:MAG: hypothetical protein BECKLFY1418B_GA0070995_100910 [Candidatus Kentron sp. LFY]
MPGCSQAFQQGVIAFETLRYKEKLDALETVSADNLDVVMDIFSELDDIEATLYHQIIRERIRLIRTLQKKAHEDNALDKVIQQRIFEHLWLLDPSWERAATSEYMEQQVRTEFGKIEAGLTEEEKLARLDLGYRTASGKHILVELKRADRRVSVYELAIQINKYKEAIVKLLKAQQRDHEPFEFVCIIGVDIREWEQTDGRKLVEDTLRPLNARVVMYPELLSRAYDSYKAFMEQHEKAGRINRLLDAIDAS